MKLDSKTKMWMCLCGVIVCAGCYRLEHKTEDSIFVADDGHPYGSKSNKLVQVTNTDSISVHNWIKQQSKGALFIHSESYFQGMTGNDRKAPIEERISDVFPDELDKKYQYVQSSNKWLLLRQNDKNGKDTKYKAIYLNSDSIRQTNMMKQCTPETIMTLAEWRDGLGIQTPLIKRAQHNAVKPNTDHDHIKN